MVRLYQHGRVIKAQINHARMSASISEQERRDGKVETETDGSVSSPGAPSKEKKLGIKVREWTSGAFSEPRNSIAFSNKTGCWSGIGLGEKKTEPEKLASLSRLPFGE